MGEKWGRQRGDWDDDDLRNRSWARKKRRSSDVDRAFDLVRTEVVEPMLDPYKRAAREAERAERRERAKRESERQTVATGAGLLAGGIMLTIGLHGLVAVGFGLLAGGLTNYLMRAIQGDAPGGRRRAELPPAPVRPSLEAPKVNASTIPTTRAELVQKVLGEATEDLKKLDAALPNLRDFTVVASVAKIVAVGQRVTQAVAENPEKLSSAQRLFTFYCPKAVEVVTTLIELQKFPQPDEKRMEATRDVLTKLELVFDETELDLKSVDGQVLDIELRVLNQSLDEDLRR